MVVDVIKLILRKRLPGRLKNLMPQFLRFGVVGVIGFGVDTAVVYALRGLIGIYAAGLISFLVAASGNWLLNRLWTFKGHGKGSAFKQWLLFLTANSAGFVLNRGIFFALVATLPMVRLHPVLGIFAGTLMGMGANFALSHRVVFQAHRVKDQEAG